MKLEVPTRLAMVPKSINDQVLQSLDLSFVDLDISDLDVDDLKNLDIWVDQYNHHVGPTAGISSSKLLTLLVLEDIVDDLIDGVLEDLSNGEYSQVQDAVATLQEEMTDFEQYNTVELASIVVLSAFVDQNKELDQVKPVSIASRLPVEKYTDNFASLFDRKIMDTTLFKTIHNHPDSLEDQLSAILDNLPSRDKYEPLILKTIDLIKEQTKFRGGGPGEIELPDYDDFYPEAYTPDKDWMPKVVLLAKHTKVWLHQLSRKYDQTINQLDQIPDHEIKEIVDRGFTTLWLIGIWERSAASRRIKERMGNPDAAASAYSLWDYNIAADLGGHEAYYDLSERADQLGLKLASDMVPNHTGILSKWIIEHPDWFIQVDEPPFPSYKFDSEDLSDHQTVNIYLEDHYYSHSDASVVFKRVDTENNNVRYIYHGNDGTSIPWNDTAQLDFLKEEVRQNVINTILHVAKMFPVIRLDAAMVLTKKHFQRLWYPVPGTGGDIPSRSRHGMSKKKFKKLFPVEFWREVVNRIETEVPNTLLVAEAFWMLEGYFVRTLGVHRVYNSAFMHMLRDQKNEEYRGLIKSTLTYDPLILQRYVNFMSNPDEDTAIEQFGNSDKYFGVAVMMSTLPGMPMFGHGQIEGYHEKYGMEFQRDYWNEDPDENLIQHHEDLIFPLLKKRYLFAQVKYFRLYDFYDPGGNIIEDIYALSNLVGDEFVIVFYNNAMQSRNGWIKNTLPYNAKILELGDEEHVQSSLYDELLQLPGTDWSYCIFKNFYADQFYIRLLDSIKKEGIYTELNGYQFKIFHNFQLIPASSRLDEFYSDYDGSSLEKVDLPDEILAILDQ